MQMDMHYYGVYVLARLAGLNREAAGIIARSSQFVDNSTVEEVEDHPMGAKLVPETTAHHTMDKKNIDLEDQRKIWVPFHFLPGNEGTNFYERLACGKDSALAQEMLRHYLANVGHPWAVELMGVAAHVYADTFAHYGFSGVSSPLNRINGRTLRYSVEEPRMDDYIKDKKESFRKKYGREMKQVSFLKQCESETLEQLSGALGHVAVFTYPDRPYMVWSFKYELGEKTEKTQMRDNPATYMEGAQKLHSFFRAFLFKRPDLSDQKAALDYGAVQTEIIKIVIFEGEKEKRCQKWQNLFATVAKDRNLDEVAKGRTSKSPIPKYDEVEWHHIRDGFHSLPTAGAITTEPVYRFFQAASFHRHYVLRELLPSYGLVVY